MSSWELSRGGHSVRGCDLEFQSANQDSSWTYCICSCDKLDVSFLCLRIREYNHESGGWWFFASSFHDLSGVGQSGCEDSAVKIAIIV